MLPAIEKAKEEEARELAGKTVIETIGSSVKKEDFLPTMQVLPKLIIKLYKEREEFCKGMTLEDYGTYLSAAVKEKQNREKSQGKHFSNN